MNRGIIRGRLASKVTRVEEGNKSKMLFLLKTTTDPVVNYSVIVLGDMVDRVYPYLCPDRPLVIEGSITSGPEFIPYMLASEVRVLCAFQGEDWQQGYLKFNTQNS